MMKTIFFRLKLNMVKNLRLKIVLARKRPVCCTLYSKKHTCIMVVSVCILQSIMYFSCVTATNSHCTQRCFHLISHVVFSFSSFFSLFLFFCLRLSFATIWFSSCVLSTTSLLNRIKFILIIERKKHITLTTRANASETILGRQSWSKLWTNDDRFDHSFRSWNDMKSFHQSSVFLSLVELFLCSISFIDWNQFLIVCPLSVGQNFFFGK